MRYFRLIDKKTNDQLSLGLNCGSDMELRDTILTDTLNNGTIKEYSAIKDLALPEIAIYKGYAVQSQEKPYPI